jgi:hypothetical protein
MMEENKRIIWFDGLEPYEVIDELAIIYTIDKDIGSTVHKIGNLKLVQEHFDSNKEKYFKLEQVADTKVKMITIPCDKITQEDVNKIANNSGYLGIWLKRNGIESCRLLRSNSEMEWKDVKFTVEDLKRYWFVECPKCGWKGLSRDTDCSQIADTGDYDDPKCPKCHTVVNEVGKVNVNDRNIDGDAKLVGIEGEVEDAIKDFKQELREVKR